MRGKIVETYDYTTLAGDILFQVVRFDPKDFRQRRPDGHGGYLWSVKGLNRVVYRLPDIQERPAVFITEGEKDCDRLASIGLHATTCVGGAGKWRAEYATQLVDAGVKRVAILPDNDDAGRRHADQVASSCHAAGLEARIVTLPDVPAKGDVSDYLEPHSKNELLTLIRGVPVHEPAASAGAGHGTETTAPDPSTLSCEALLAEHELCALDEHIDRAVLDGRLRKLAAALRGSDRLRVALVRETLITHLREAAKIRTAAKIVDAAFTIETTTPETHQGTPLLLADVDPWPEPVDGNVVLDEVVRTITRFIVLPTHGAVALALWILHTYVMNTWWLSPLAVATSPTRRCGKTALLTVVSELVHRPVAASNISPAALFRAVEKYQPTLLLDEGETWLKANEELRGIVKAGHTRRTAMVIRTVGDDHEPATFSTWCAKFIALIGELPSALHDRAADNWRPLLALSDSLGGEWPTLGHGPRRNPLPGSTRRTPSGCSSCGTSRRCSRTSPCCRRRPSLRPWSRWRSVPGQPRRSRGNR